MQKQTLISKRFTVWNSLCEFDKRTGEIVNYDEKTSRIDAKIDGDDYIRNYFLRELYFYDHPLGYNQKCFN